MKIVFTGGGTGGHVFPILEVVRELEKVIQEQGPKIQKFNSAASLYYLGPKEPTIWALLSMQGVSCMSILSGKARRYFSIASLLQNLLDLLVFMPLGILQAFGRLFFLAPDVVFSKGGQGALPVVIGAWLLQIPILVHESDTVAGLSNKISAKLANEVFTAFAETAGIPAHKQIVVGNPIRQGLLKGDKERAIKTFQLQSKKPVVLVMGGSQGATRVNELVLNIIGEWLRDFELLHITGPNNYDDVRAEGELVVPDEVKSCYHPTGFLNEQQMADAYAVADIIVTRAGAGSIFELAALGKPSILIPLPESAQNHQYKNAYNYARSGATVVVEQANVTPHFILERIKYLFAHPEEYKRMSEAAFAFARPKAGKIIAEYIFAFLVY